jgi:hypothetical protein
MKVMCSGWIAARLVVVFIGALFGALAALDMGPDAWFVAVVAAPLIFAGLAWASFDVVVVTRRRIYRGFRSIDVEKIEDFGLRKAERRVSPNTPPHEGYEIVALTKDGDWPIGLFAEDRGRWGGVVPRIYGRMAALRTMILR